MNRITLADLLPTGKDLALAAYGSTCGDNAWLTGGVHGGRNPARSDVEGLSKRIIYDHAVVQDMAFFDGLALRVLSNPWTFPASRRTWIAKAEGQPDKGVRPIDDPAEFKRLVLLHVRQRLERRMEGRMTVGQFGGRPAWAIEPVCSRNGATHQDHVAAAIHKGVSDGFGEVVLIDLRDAFGQVPHKTVINALKGIGLDDEAARWIVRLVQIDAVDGKQHHARDSLGIEQGNQMSAVIMNLVLAPIFRNVQAALPVKVLSYVDDIYMLCPDADVARQAFYLFRQSARSRGFSNVRPLVGQIDGNDSKNSRIIDTALEQVPVLKTYLVAKDGIALHPVKVQEMKQDGTFSATTTIAELRKATNCQALNKRANRNTNPGLLRLPPKESNKTDPKGLVVSVAADTGQTMELGGGRLHANGAGEEGLFPYMGNHQGDGHDVVETPGQGLPDAQHGYCDDLDGDDLNRHVLVYPYRDDDVPTNGVQHHDVGLLLSFVAVPSQSNQAGSNPGTSTRISTMADGRNMPKDSGQVGTATPPARLSVLLPEIRDAIQRRKPIKAADNYKGGVLDLMGFDNVLGCKANKQDVVEATVNGLIKAVRMRKRAVVVYDPASSLAAVDFVLGGQRDKVYARESAVMLDDGTVQVELRHRPRAAPKPDLPPLPVAELVVLSARRTNRATGKYVFHTMDRHVHRDICVYVPGPSEVAGVLTGLLKVLQHVQPAVTVAVKLHGLLKAVSCLADGARPRLVPMHDAVAKLTKSWAWKRKGDCFIIRTPIVVGT